MSDRRGPQPPEGQDRPFLRPDDLLSSAWGLRESQRKKRPSRATPPRDDDDDDIVEVNLDGLDDVDPLFPAALHDRARDHLKAWCESVDEDVWVLNLDDEDDL